MTWQETQDAANGSADSVLTSGPGAPCPFGIMIFFPNGQGFCPNLRFP